MGDDRVRYCAIIVLGCVASIACIAGAMVQGAVGAASVGPYAIAAAAVGAIAGLVPGARP